MVKIRAWELLFDLLFSSESQVFPVEFLCVLKMYHVRLFIVEKMGLEWLLDDVGFIQNLSRYCRKLVFYMLLKPQLRMQKCAYIRMLWPTYVGCCPCTWAEGHFGHFISKNRFFFSHLKGYIFHFNTSQVNLISDQALNWPQALEFGHHCGKGARVIRGTKYNVYKCPSFDL